MAMPTGLERAALVAGPPSPENPPPDMYTPSPATVEITPLFAETFLMRLLRVSAMKRFPAASSAKSLGLESETNVAGRPSSLPPPAMVKID